jgi:hypothetical protein
MRTLRDNVWQRCGISWIWDALALSQVTQVDAVFSLRQFLQTVGHWSDDLPSNNGNTLVVAGLDACLDLLIPNEAEQWLDSVIKPAILSFQDHYQSDGALVFWLPSAQGRIKANSATDAITWHCAHPYGQELLDFGRILWGEASEYPQEILLSNATKPAGLFHKRIT